MFKYCWVGSCANIWWWFQIFLECSRVHPCYYLEKMNPFLTRRFFRTGGKKATKFGDTIKVARLNGAGGHWAFPVQLYAGGESGPLGG